MRFFTQCAYSSFGERVLKHSFKALSYFFHFPLCTGICLKESEVLHMKKTHRRLTRICYELDLPPEALAGAF